jgi:hypothetical protein
LTKRRRAALAIVVSAAASLAVSYRQLTGHAVFACAHEDSVLFVNWVRQVAESMASGVFFPRWLPESHGGYGNPTFIFYPPLVIYLTALIELATGDPFFSIAMVKFLGLFLSALFMYVFIEDLWGFGPALASALAYVLLPFRVFDLYYLGVYASKLAFVWFPLILYFSKKAVSEARLGAGTAGVGVTYALLCLTHLLSAYMFTPVLVVFGLIAVGRGSLRRAAARLAVGCVLGVALSAFYILPVMTERSLVHFDVLVNLDIHRYWNNYLFFLFEPRSALNPEFYGYVARVVIASVICGAALYLFCRPLKRRAEGYEAAFFMAVTVVSLFLMSSLSGFVWAFVPGMKLLQYPTRWSAVMVFGLACLVGGATHGVDIRGSLAGGRTMALLGLALVLILLSGYYDVEIVKNGCRLTERELDGSLRSLDVKEYVPAAVSLDWLAREAHKEGSGLVSCPDEKDLTAVVKDWSPLRRVFTVDAPHEIALRLRTFYYPGWKGYVDGVETPLSTERDSGAILVRVPKGEHDVVLKFTDTLDRWVGKIFSALALFGAFLMIKRSRPVRRRV